MALIFCYSAFSSAIDALQVSFGLSNNSCLFVLFQQIIDYKKRQYRGEVLRPTAQWHYSQSRRHFHPWRAARVLSRLRLKKLIHAILVELLAEQYLLITYFFALFLLIIKSLYYFMLC